MNKKSFGCIYCYDKCKNGIKLMRNTLLIILLAVFQAFAADGYAQSTRLSLDMHNVHLKEVLQQIEDKSDYSFLYNSSLVDVQRSVDVEAKDATIDEILNNLFAGTDVNKIVKDRHIILIPRQSDNGQEQKQTFLSGRITDQQGNPLAGVAVVFDSSNTGVTTDANGRYRIAIPKDAKTITVMFVGMQNQTIEINNRTAIDIVMAEDVYSIEAVVAIGFGSQKKANLTGAVSSVAMNDVLGTRPVTSVTSALQGVVPGLTISSTNGIPGQDATYNIRGTTSINSSGNDALILVNNVPMDINMIDPQDVETVTLLKDAASTAIYGARAAYGVILITTKQGSRNTAPVFNYNNNLSFSMPTELPRKASPLEEVTAYSKMGFSGDLYVDGRNINTWKGYLESYLQNPSQYPKGYFYDENSSLYWLTENQGFDDMTSDYGFQQNHNISASGGSESSRYHFSLGYTNEDGILITDKDSYKRLNTSVYYELDINKWLTIKADMRYAQSKRSLVEDGGRGGVWNSVMSMPSWYSAKTYEWEGVEYPVESSATYLQNSDPRKYDKNVMRLFGSAVITPVKDFTITGEYTFNRTGQTDKTHNNHYKYIDKGLSGIAESTTQTSYSARTSSTLYNAVNIYANYSKTIADDHNIAATAGFNYEQSYYEELYGYNTNLLVDNLPSLSVCSGTATADDAFSEYAVMGSFYRLSYDYRGKYMFMTSGRYDGSSRFPAKSRFGFFPSVSGAWRVSEERFMDWSDNWLSNLKLRMSWGQIGNQNVDNYAYIPSMGMTGTTGSTNSSWIQGGKRMLTFSQPGMVSFDFTWEVVESIDYAVELGLLNNRLTAVFDIYRRKTTGMLAPGIDLPSVVGADSPEENTANLRTDGWELKLDWHDRIGDWSYRVGASLYDSKSKITKYDDNDTYSLSSYYKGQTIGEIWGYKTLRLAQADDFNSDGSLKEGLYKYKTVTQINPGDVLYEDLDGDHQIYYGDNTALNSGDRTVIGNNRPRYQYGITGAVEYKGLELSFILQGVGKRDIWRTDQMAWPTGTWGVNFKNTLDFWSTDNTDAYYPRVYASDAVNTSVNHLTQTRYLANGAYLRLQNISISYSLPSHWIKSIGLGQAKVYVSGENLHTWDHMPEGMDPEMASTGSWTYPFMKKYSVGVNVTF